MRELLLKGRWLSVKSLSHRSPGDRIPEAPTLDSRLSGYNLSHFNLRTCIYKQNKTPHMILCSSLILFPSYRSTTDAKNIKWFVQSHEASNYQCSFIIFKSCFPKLSKDMKMRIPESMPTHRKFQGNGSSSCGHLAIHYFSDLQSSWGNGRHSMTATKSHHNV